MDDRMKYILLKILSEKGNVDGLEKTGYQYAQIARAYSMIINEGLVVPDESMKLHISEKGYEEMLMLRENLCKRGKWKIEPYIEYMVEKMGKYDIFIE